MDRHIAHMGESRNAMGRSEGKRPSGRPKRRYEVNIKMDLREVVCVRAVMNLQVP